MENSFTTMDDTYHKEFRRMAASKIDMDGAKWVGVADIAKTLVKTAIEKENSFRLMPFVQSLSLKISLYVLFDKDPRHLDDKDVFDLAYAINELWEESKCMESTKKISHLQYTLRKALLVIFPNQSLAPRDTPMNMIIPTYETLWRVVLRMFLEVTFRNLTAAPGWRQTLHSYIEDQRTFKSSSAKTVSASVLVDEALRLYPPTRRLHRTFRLESEAETITVSADIESCQRRPETWGQQNCEFLPTRWEFVDQEVRKTFNPFGGSTFTCPAKKVFGPHMIGVLVAAMTEYIAETDWEIKSSRESREDVFAEGPLNSDRRAYNSLVVSRKSRIMVASAS